MSRRLGLIVGLNQYQDPLFRPLQFAENDARAFAQWLVNTQGGNWSPGDVQIVQGTHATKELIEPMIAQLCLQTAGPDDLVLLYFAGQAFVDEYSGEGYLALANTSYQNSRTGLHLFAFVNQVLARCQAAQVVCILDCFQTGRAWSMQRSSAYDFKPLLGPSTLSMLQQMPNRLFFCSCRGNEFSAESSERGLGQFMYRLILGLCGPAVDPASNTITLQQLHSYLLGTLGDQQRPQIFGQGQQPVVLVGTSADEVATPAMATPASAQSAPAQPTATPQTAYGQEAFPPSGSSPAYPPFANNSPSQSQFTSNDEQRRQQSEQLIQLAQQHVQTQRMADALNTLDQALQIWPQSSNALVLKGQLLGSAGRIPEALTTVEQLLQIEPQNALGWSMKAVLLNNMSQFQAAKDAIERSLEIDPNNPESYAIKTNIMAGMAMAQAQQQGPGSQPLRITAPQKAPETTQNTAVSFFLFTLVQIFAFLLSIVGIGLMILKPTLPPLLGLGIASLGMALLCVGAARGTFRFGFLYFLPVILLSVVAAALVGGLYKVGYSRLLLVVRDNPQLLIPVVLLVLWLALDAVLPLPFAIGGVIGGAIAKARRRNA